MMNEWVSDRRQEAEPPFEDDMERPLYCLVVRLPVGEEVCLNVPQDDVEWVLEKLEEIRQAKAHEVQGLHNELMMQLEA